MSTTTIAADGITLRAALAACVCMAACTGAEEAREVEEPAIEGAADTAEVADAGVDAGHDAGPPRPPARLFAKRFVTKIRERPDRESFRVGYLRAGAVVMATTADPVRTDDPRCREGWYELTTGGFVCNGRDVIAFQGRRLPQARGEQPNRTAPLPYTYGRNRRNNAPMYRRLPTDEEAAEFEGFRIPGQEPLAEEGAEGGEGAPPEGAAGGTAAGGAAAGGARGRDRARGAGRAAGAAAGGAGGCACAGSGGRRRGAGGRRVTSR
ncbi:MAG: hypothetical protein M5U28_49675 [Sandaracinaceae bacterium]|nr:hypothetical protein [Sandaracinaceae bacterium]